jgi:hypothetical protein
MDEDYNKKAFKKKINKLKNLYDLNNPEDLFIIIPQEMEVMEVKGIALGYNGAKKKKLVIDVITKIAKENSIKLNQKTLSTFIDTINTASKGKYALNKGTQ